MCWPEPARLLTGGRWLVVPAADADRRPFQAARWLHLPKRVGRLTDPERLAAALDRLTPDLSAPA